ncbi:type IV pilus twitching motility protein PilT [Komagataeibacter xylinus]|uniref:Secretion protein n=2 Tax=Acetobacteraceae TaxID=433 RepID=A0A857FVC4_KOMXY|nr:ATPase, T2SS/T4P/T4SS family [Komagataeibacter xylinus]QHC37420.1 secretion protein [Komagataeibacter xylinus]
MNITIPVTTDEPWPDEGRKAFAWVEERRRNAPGLDSLLRWAHGLGASRIDIKTGHPVTIKVHGVIRYATCKATDSLALADIVGHVYASDGMAMLGVGHILDTAYSVALDRKVNLRFRINLSPISVKRGSGVHVVMRPIPARPASLDQQMVEQEIRDTNRLKSGMVLFGGATGSGKTTLQFGLAIEKLMDPTVYCDMATGEEPIEFLLDDLRPPSGSRISQTEIRPPTLTFPTFTRSLTRREMSDGIITECRDGETMNAAINIAMMGGILGTTLHADSVSLMIQRAIALCPPSERDNLVSALAQALRFCINQRLVPRKGGGRVAIREFLTFDRDLRRKLTRTEPTDWPDVVADAVEAQGQSFGKAIRKLLDADLITEDTALAEERRDA